jgi:hypothetical protein
MQGAGGKSDQVVAGRVEIAGDRKGPGFGKGDGNGRAWEWNQDPFDPVSWLQSRERKRGLGQLSVGMWGGVEGMEVRREMDSPEPKEKG